jgi:hypothetical protein
MGKRWMIGAVTAMALLIVAACTTALPTGNDQVAGESAPAPETEAAEEEASTEESVAESNEVALLPASSPPFGTSNWSTDFSRRTVEWEEILSGGPPKDGIPAVDTPTFESPEEAASWLSERDPVIVFENDGTARAYPLAILIWHEIVNDEVGGMPVSVTFCPLCNASIVFDRQFGDQLLDFGTTGKLRNSDLIMYDRQTETWWQQFTGQGIVGELTGSQLRFLPSQVLSFGDFVNEFPEGEVMQRPPAGRRYGTNPYQGYYSQVGRPFLFSGELDERLRPTERVVGLELGDVAIAYPFSVAAEAGVINDEVAGRPVAILHKAGTASALGDATINQAEDVGSTAVFNRQVEDQTLTFSANGDGTFNDEETGSTWNILGEAIDGEMAGTELAQEIAFDHFWFAWSAFFPETELYSVE